MKLTSIWTITRQPLVAAMAGGMLTLCLSGSAVAQSQRSSQDERQQQQTERKEQQKQKKQEAEQRQRAQQRQRQTDRPQANQQQDSRSQDRGRQRQQAQQSQAQMRLEPTGWIRIAADYDQDGQFDAVKTIYAFDLQQAEAKSRRRAQEQRGQQGQARRQDQRSRQQQARSGQRPMALHRLQGELTNLKKVTLAGYDDQHLIARLKTEDSGRTAKVDLGPQSQLSKLDLQEGDRVLILGVPGRINQKVMLMALGVQSDDQRVVIKRPRLRQQKQTMEVDVVSTRTTKFKGRDQEHVIAKVRLDSGRTADVILGPKNKLQDLEIQQGDELTLLVRSARLNGNSAFVAEQVRIDGQVAEISRMDTRLQRRGSSQQR